MTTNMVANRKKSHQIPNFFIFFLQHTRNVKYGRIFPQLKILAEEPSKIWLLHTKGSTFECLKHLCLASIVHELQ